MIIISGYHEQPKQGKQEYIEARKPCYPSRNRAGKSVMIDELSDGQKKNKLKVGIITRGHTSDSGQRHQDQSMIE